MEYRFNAEEWDALTPENRVRRCRLLAQEALKMADGAKGSMKDALLAIAADWERLGTEIERNCNR